MPHAFLGYATNFSPPDPTDNGVQLLPPIDGVDLVSDNTDLLENPVFRPALRRLYT